MVEKNKADPEDLVLDESQLAAATSADQGDIYLLQWLAQAEKAVKELDEEDVRQAQPSLISSLLRLLGCPPTASFPSSSSPTSVSLRKPGRPARHIMARLFVATFRRGDTKSLFEVAQNLLRGATGEVPKGFEISREARTASCFVLGDLFKELGGQVISLLSDAVTGLIKILKATSQPVILRYHAVLSLQKAIQTAGNSIVEQQMKDIVKQLRNGLHDKAAAVQRACADCLSLVASENTLFSTTNEIESILSVIIKALDSADFPTCRALSRLAAGILAWTQSEGSVPLPEVKKKPSKKKKDGADGSDEDDPYPVPVAGSGGPTSAGGEAVRATLLSPEQMLSLLSAPFNKSSTSRRTRNAILDVYGTTLTRLGTNWVETNYAVLLKHLFEDLPNHPRNSTSPPASSSAGSTNPRFETLATRRAIGLLMRRLVGVRLLTEQGQVMAVREIATSILKRYPALMPGQTAPTKYTHVLALDEVASLVGQLGSVPSQLQDALSEPLLRITEHPSHSVQIAAAWALRSFVMVNPNRLTSTVAIVMEGLQRDLNSLTNAPPPSSSRPQSPAQGSFTGSPSPDLARRTMGHTRALAALLAVMPCRPLYVSFDQPAKVLSMSINLLKASANHELHISGVEITVAWTLIGALMSLGPNFVRTHLAQLLVLWRNALPKPASKDAEPGGRSDGEWAFLLHVREATLGAMLCFLKHNRSKLLSLETARRLVTLLANTLQFSNHFRDTHSDLAQEVGLSSLAPTGTNHTTLTLLDRDLLLRRRLLQCVAALGPVPLPMYSSVASSAIEPMHPALLSAALTELADPDAYIGSTAQAAIAASAGNFKSVWSCADGYAFGVTGLVVQGETRIGEAGGDGAADGLGSWEDDGDEDARSSRSRSDWLNRDAIEAELEGFLQRPILGAPEHDPLVLYASSSSSPSAGPASSMSLPLPTPVATSAVDASIWLFALLFPTQSADVQANTLEQLQTHLRSSKLEKNPGRKMAIEINAVVALLGALRVSMRGGKRLQDGWADKRVNGAAREILRNAILSNDVSLRKLGSEAFGRLATVAGSQFMTAQIQYLVDHVVSDRDPDGRAGCALAFGAIYSHVGGLAASPLTKTIVNVLMSLSNDPHPVVHFWAMQALVCVVDAASLSYSPFVTSTLGMLVKLYMQDSHEPEGGSIGSVNLRGDLPALQVICKLIDASVGVLGPELQEETKARAVLLTVLGEFNAETDEGIRVEAIKCLQHLAMFAPDAVDLPLYIDNLRAHLGSRIRPLKIAAINGFYQLAQRNATLMSKLGGDKLVEDFFKQLDDDPSIDGVREVILSWLRQTSEHNPSGWIDLCQRIMSRATASADANKAAAAPPKPALQDDEVATINVGGDAPSARLTSRWRTQLFALQCVHEIFLTVVRSGRMENFDVPPGGLAAAERRGLLINRVADIIRMAFTASTAHVSEIRLEGLTVLGDVIERFSRARDPDFDDTLLLEQHQAPIAAALTPAFSSDSTPEVLAAAVRLSAVFVGSGVVKELDKMGRIAKLLTASLESCKYPNMSSLGDVSDLSSNAAAMLKVSVFAAWAELQVASASGQKYVETVLRPHVPSLCGFWLASLREYAKIHNDPDGASSMMGVSASSGLDVTYSAVAREVIAPYYERSWYKMLHAVTVLMRNDDPSIAKAMDGIQPDQGKEAEAIRSPSKTRAEPALFFFVLYGLAFEALATTAGVGAAGPGAAPTMRTALEALQSLCRSEYAGPVMLQDSTFEELCNLCYRVVMTESSLVQVEVVELVTGLAESYGAQLLSGSEKDSTVLAKGSKLTQCLRIVVYVLGHARLKKSTSNDQVQLLRAAFAAFTSIVTAFPPLLHESLFGIGFLQFSELLKDESSEVDLVGPNLPSLKMLCDQAWRAARPGSDVLPRIVQGFLSSTLQNIEEIRGRQHRIVTIKAKNNMLAAVLVLTSLPPASSSTPIKVSQTIVEHLCYLLVSHFSVTDPEVSLTAVHCAKSLVLASARGGPAMQYAVGQLLPGLVEWLAKASEETGSWDGSMDPRKVKAEEVMKALVGLAGAVGEAQRTHVLAIVLPVLILFLSSSPTSATTSPAHNLAVAQLVGLATSHPAPFREATAALEAEQRGLLEASVRRALGGAEKDAQKVQKKEEPKIELKMFG